MLNVLTSYTLWFSARAAEKERGKELNKTKRIKRLLMPMTASAGSMLWRNFLTHLSGTFHCLQLNFHCFIAFNSLLFVHFISSYNHTTENHTGVWLQPGWNGVHPHFFFLRKRVVPVTTWQQRLLKFWFINPEWHYHKACLPPVKKVIPNYSNQRLTERTASGKGHCSRKLSNRQ